MMRTVFVLQIVEENRKIAHANFIHDIEFAHQQSKILFALLAMIAEVKTGRHREDKANVVLLRDGNQISQRIEFVSGVRLAPFLAVIWIILGRVYVSIQMVAMAEAENIGAFFSSPLFSVETFDDTAKGDGSRKCCS